MSNEYDDNPEVTQEVAPAPVEAAPEDEPPVVDEVAAEAQREATGKSWRRTLDLSAVGLAFPIALAIGYALGSGIGDRIGYPVAGRVVGSIVGALAGFHNLLHMANRK